MTGRLGSQVPAVPVDVVMPAQAQLVGTIAIAACCVGALGFALLRSRRLRTPGPVLLLAGGALAVVDEPVLNQLGGLWHARHGQWTLFEIFDRPMPVWAAGGYLLFFGAVPLVILTVLTRSDGGRTGTRAAFYRTIGVILAIELPVVGSGMYVYYGYQPYKLFGILPAEWLFINGLAPATTAVLLYRFPDLVAGARWPLMLLLPLITQYAALSVGIPFYSAFNGGASPLVSWLAATFSMGLGAAAFVGLGRLLPSPNQRMSPIPGPSMTPVHR